jgi:apolipoprotein N-acyltransferase
LGYSQQSHRALIQSVDLCGIYGLSFLLVLVNATLAGTVLALARRSLPTLPWKGLAVAAVFFATNLGYGYFRLEQDLDGRERTLSVAMVQGNIDQSAKWRPANQQSTVSTYRDLSLAAARANKTDLLIWPESATPFYFQDGGPLSDAVVATARTADAWLLFGSPAYELSTAAPAISTAPSSSPVTDSCSVGATRFTLSPSASTFPSENISHLSTNWWWGSAISLPGRSAPCR